MTVYANLVDGEVKGVYDLLPKTWNNILNFDVKARLDRELMSKNKEIKLILIQELIKCLTFQHTLLGTVLYLNQEKYF